MSAPTTTTVRTTTVPVVTTTVPPQTTTVPVVTTSPLVQTTVTRTTSVTVTTTTASETASPSPAAAAPGPNWTLIGGVGGGIVAAILLIGAISFFTKASKESKRRKNPDSFDALYSNNHSGPVTAPRVQAIKVAPEPGRDSRSTPNAEPVYESYAMKPAQPSIAPTVQTQQYIQPHDQQQYQQQQYQQYNPSIVSGYPSQQPAQYYQQQQYPQQAAVYGQPQYYQPQHQQSIPVGQTADGQPDYTAQWQQYFAENPGAYEQYMAQQQQQQQQQAGSSGATYDQYVTASPVSQSQSPTYEEFVEAQNAASLAVAEGAGSSATASRPAESSATLALH
ncbi:hypothetical protein BDR26DRAFT_872017, partial [Obelidium mucronatum]